MTRSAIAKALGLVALGVVLGVGFLVGPRHVHWPKPAPAPAPVPADPTPAPSPEDLPEWFHAGPKAPAGSARAAAADGASLLGWRADGGHRAIAAKMPKLSQVAPHLVEAKAEADHRPILLYKAYTKLFRRPPPYPPQGVGDCVGMAHAHAVDLLQCVEFSIAHPGKRPTPDDIQEIDSEWVYGASREIVGQLGRWDGSYGAAAVQAMTQWGLISRRMLGASGEYDGQRARRWARTGVPPEIRAKAARFKLGAGAQVTSWDELEGALSAGSPVTICTQSAFDLQRDADGFCRARRCWPAPIGCGGHCMFIAGMRYDRPGVLVVQSWGPDTPSGPKALDQPDYSFWADRAAVESILAEGDSWALSRSPRWGKSAGKGPRKLPDFMRKAS